LLFRVGLEAGIVEKDTVSMDFRKQVLGYGLTTAEIVYRRPDGPWLLQTYVWQDYDLFPNFPALTDFLAFWEKSLEGPLFAVTVAHSKLVKPTELHSVDGVLSAAPRPGLLGSPGLLLGPGYTPLPAALLARLGIYSAAGLRRLPH
jgi:uncharacterized protein Usg